MSLQPGHRLGPYEIVAPIEAGGMGEVYRARDTRLERTVAAPLTSEGMVVRTFQYMSPEQIEGRALDHRTDIFSLGVLRAE